jgi:hypothetical protein
MIAAGLPEAYGNVEEYVTSYLLENSAFPELMEAVLEHVEWPEVIQALEDEIELSKEDY